MAVQQTQTLPPPYVTAPGEQFGQFLLGTKPITDSPFYVDPSSFTGEQFVAGQDQLTKDAQALASGLGSYQPYLQRAEDFQTDAGAFFKQNMGVADPYMQKAGADFDAMSAAAAAGQDAGAAFMAPAAFQQFMSPFQQDVIDTTMADYQQELAKQQAQLGAGAGSAFGGGRFGVAQGELGAQGALGMASTLAGLRQSGFEQANQLAANAFTQANQQALQNQQMYGAAGAAQAGMAQQAQQQLGNTLAQYGGLSQAQQGLGEFSTGMLGNQINALTQMGQQNLALEQARLDAKRLGLREQAFAPQQGLGFMGQQLAAAYGSPAGSTFTTTPDPSTAQTLLGAGTGILGILGAAGVFGGNKTV